MSTEEYENSRAFFLNCFGDLIIDNSTSNNEMECKNKKQTKLDNKLSTNLFCSF